MIKTITLRDESIKTEKILMAILRTIVMRTIITIIKIITIVIKITIILILIVIIIRLIPNFTADFTTDLDWYDLACHVVMVLKVQNRHYISHKPSQCSLKLPLSWWKCNFIDLEPGWVK